MAAKSGRWLLHVAAIQLCCVLRADAAADRSRKERASLIPGDVGSSAMQADATVGALKSAYPFYHSSKEIQSEAREVVDTCTTGHAAMWTIEEGPVQLDVLDLRPQNNGTNINNVFLLFGEHPRELVSPESGLHFLKVLCGKEPAEGGFERIAKLREGNAYRIVLNSNPRSRDKVEHGEFCLRTNPNGVDLNRNWDEYFHTGTGGDTNGGEKAFSEPESQMLRKLVDEFRPHTFLTVHSGTKGMYMPWAYDMEHLATRNGPQMLEVLKALDNKHCQCPYGAAGKEVGYSCPGTCLDYVYDKLQAPYAFAFEIWADPEQDRDLRERWNNKMENGGASLLQQGDHLAHAHFADLFHAHTSDFVQTREAQHKQSTQMLDCFPIFNPGSKEAYDNTMTNWSETYISMSEMIVARLFGNQASVKV